MPEESTAVTGDAADDAANLAEDAAELAGTDAATPAANEAAEVATEEGADLAAEENETATSLTMRYLKNTLSWVSAVEYLAKSRIGHGPTNPHLNLCLLMTPAPSESARMADMLPFFIQAAQEVRAEIPEDDVDAYEKWVKQRRYIFTRPLSFEGSIHCEASLMAAMLDPTTGAGKSIAQFFKVSVVCVLPRQPDNNPTTTQLPLDKKCVIGVSKKCCWCCAQLASLIARCERKTFILPGSHGQIFPWALPSGISQEVAAALEADLRSLLVKIMRKDLLAYLRQTSSPAGSDVELTYSSEFIDAFEASQTGKSRIA